jgi:CubicO group peptidase (beta-lactamase class C family)
MRRRWVLRRIAWLAGALVGIFMLTFAALLVTWAYRGGFAAGFTAMARLLQNGPTQIDDFRYYPARRLQASGSPYLFRESGGMWSLPELVEVGEGPQLGLEEVLYGNDTIAFLVVKGDELVYERYYQGHSREEMSQSFSASKSVTSALVGLAIQDGYLHAVEQRVTDWVPELLGRNFENVTLEHLLTMRSGSTYVENDNPFGVHVLFNYTPELEKMILDFRTAAEPGQGFQYKSGDTALLALALSRALAPQTISGYMQERIWDPLGMEYDAVWTVDREDGLEKSWCCLAATARDFAKLGMLYLRRGDWNGQQILPAEWIERSTRGAFASEVWDEDFRAAGLQNYGYSWWLASEEEGDYLALGKDGQYIYVNPTADTVIVRLGWSQGDLPTSQWLRLFQFLSSSGG